jgi:hypothetical protein
VTVKTIGRIMRAFWVYHKPIRQIVRELRISRKTVRKAIRGSSTEFHYERQLQPQPRLGEFVTRLDGLLEANSKRPERERLTARRISFTTCSAGSFTGPDFGPICPPSMAPMGQKSSLSPEAQ